jgi:hypothetical protein
VAHGVRARTRRDHRGLGPANRLIRGAPHSCYEVNSSSRLAATTRMGAMTMKRGRA